MGTAAAWVCWGSRLDQREARPMEARAREGPRGVRGDGMMQEGLL